jgi:putative ABC transport system substrate-binding protein
MRDQAGVESGFAALASTTDTGVIVTSSPFAAIHRSRFVQLAERYKFPAIYYEGYIARVGGLMSYGPEFLDQYRRAVDFVDRILRGANPADLPVQAPTKYELVVNLKTAKALGLVFPESILARADEMIE